MNAKKPRRRAPKLTQKVDKSVQNRRVIEGKSNITAKRVTLLPGFLINGFVSNTIQKAKVLDDSRKKKNHLLNENLQAFLEQKGKHPRRSQRILKKCFGPQSTNGSKTSSSNHCDTLEPTAINNISFKPILKNNSKSLFKDISDRFSKVNICNTESLTQKQSLCTEENRSLNQNCNYFEEISDHNLQFSNQTHQNLNENILNLNQNSQFLNQNHFGEVLPPEPGQNVFRIDLNRSFCRNLEKQISVTFKRNVLDECRGKIKKEIDNVNLALQGKLDVEAMVVYYSQDNQSGVEGSDGPASKFYPVPAQNWVYRTPPNQKISEPQMEECHIQAVGVLCQNKNQQNLYEVMPSLNVDFSKLRHSEDVRIDDRFMKKVAEVRKTPANFEFRGYRSDGRQNVFPLPCSDSAGCSGSAELSGRKDSFVNPNFANIMTRPMKAPRNRVFANYFEENMSTPRVLPGTKTQNYTELQDVTFVEDGDDFKMQESQPAGEQRNKRKLSDGELVMQGRNFFTAEPMNAEKNKIFNFGSQERNMFKF